MGIWERYELISEKGIKVSPEGFCHFEAHLAKTLFTDNPTENVMPSSWSRSFFILFAISSYERLKYLSIPLISAKHSSILYSSTFSLYLLTIFPIRSEYKL